MIASQASMKALLETLFASADKLRADRNKLKEFSILERFVFVVMVLAFICSFVWYLAMHQIMPLLVTVGLCCIVAFWGVNSAIVNMDKFRKESEEYQIAVDLLIECIEEGWDKDEITQVLGAAYATLREQCNIRDYPEESWTLGQIEEIDTFKDYIALSNRLKNISMVLAGVRKERDDVAAMMQKLEQDELNAKLREELTNATSAAMALLVQGGTYKENLTPDEALAKAAEMLKAMREKEESAQMESRQAHIITKNPGEDLSIKA